MCAICGCTSERAFLYAFGDQGPFQPAHEEVLSICNPESNPRFFSYNEYPKMINMRGFYMVMP